MTITVQRTSDVNRSHTGENTSPEVAHQQFADKLNRDLQHQLQNVVQSNKAEEGRVDEDGRGPGGGYGGRKKKKKDSPKRQPVPAGGGSMFDVSV
jgi:hypothetical protein